MHKACKMQGQYSTACNRGSLIVAAKAQQAQQPELPTTLAARTRYKDCWGMLKCTNPDALTPCAYIMLDSAMYVCAT
jgi:hypothetical protein